MVLVAAAAATTTVPVVDFSINHELKDNEDIEDEDEQGKAADVTTLFPIQ